MNCEKCQELLSDFLDGAIDERDHATFNAHLEECLPCFNVHAELNSIVSFCRETRGDYVEPPNSQALWLRIRNTVESEWATAAWANAAATQDTRVAARRESWWSRMMERSWEMSFPRAVVAVIAIIAIASFATFFGMRGGQNDAVSATAPARLNSTGGETLALTHAGNDAKTAELNRRMQQQEIKYLSQLVEERKGHWSPQVRAAFEHNLNLWDESVEESLKKLSAQPHDEVSEEMLDAALNGKMELLKEFSAL